MWLMLVQWSQLVDAWKDVSVDEINITADISNPTAAAWCFGLTTIR